MSRIEVSRQIDAPAERVWEVITDLDAAPATLSGVESIERLSGPQFGVGTRWRETRTTFGKRASEELVVTSLNDGRSYTVEADARGAHYLSVFGVVGLDGGRSELSSSFDAKAEGLSAKVMAATVGRLFRGTTRKALARDLDDVAAEAERRALAG